MLENNLFLTGRNLLLSYLNSYPNLSSLANALGGELHSIQSNTYIALELHGTENASEVKLQFYSGTTRLGEFNVKKATGKLEWYNAITGTLTTLAQ